MITSSVVDQIKPKMQSSNKKALLKDLCQSKNNVNLLGYFGIPLIQTSIFIFLTRNEFTSSEVPNRENGVKNELIGQEEDVSLLEDLDIDIEQVKQNIKSVLFFKKFDHKFTEEPDMSGPLMICLTLAVSLILVKIS